MKPQPIEVDSVEFVIENVDFLVTRCDEHITREFREFLLATGCPAKVVGQVGY